MNGPFLMSQLSTPSIDAPSHNRRTAAEGGQIPLTFREYLSNKDEILLETLSKFIALKGESTNFPKRSCVELCVVPRMKRLFVEQSRDAFAVLLMCISTH